MKSDRQLKRAIVELGVKEPGSSDEVVSQNKLRQFESMQDELRSLQKKFAEYREGMKDAFKGGASVSTGKRGVESGIRFRRHPSYKSALIKATNDEYAQKILDQTPFRPYYYVKLITRNGNSGRREE